MTGSSRQPARKSSKPQKPQKSASSRPDASPARASGRHPDAERTVVRFTDAALADLTGMVRKGDPQVVRWALKKCLMLERDPEAGEELRGALIGYRKLTVGDRNWRVVWRITHDAEGRPIVDVAEVWAMGARSDSDVYDEMGSRVAALSADPATLPLAEVIERLGKVAAGLAGTNAEPVKGAVATSTAPRAVTTAHLPDWLAQALVKVVGLTPADVAQMSEAEAHRRWLEHISASR